METRKQSKVFPSLEKVTLYFKTFVNIHQPSHMEYGLRKLVDEVFSRNPDVLKNLQGRTHKGLIPVFPNRGRKQ